MSPTNVDVVTFSSIAAPAQTGSQVRGMIDLLLLSIKKGASKRRMGVTVFVEAITWQYAWYCFSAGQAPISGEL